MKKNLALYFLILLGVIFFLAPAQTANADMGNWEARSSGVTYTAATDGFVVATITNNDGKDVTCDVHIETPDGTVRQKARPNNDGGQVALSSPVRKGDTWKVSLWKSCGNLVIYWIPFDGNLGSWSGSYAPNTPYTAATDGFVVATITNNDGKDVTCDVHIETPDGTVRQKARPNNDGGQVALSSPVRKGDTWKVSLWKSCGNLVIYWIPYSPPAPPVGTIIENATLDGKDWNSPPFTVNYTGPSGTFTVSIDAPVDIPNLPAGTYTINAVTPPAGVSYSGVTSSSQTLSAGGTITFTFNFASTPTTGTVLIRATKDGQPWDSPAFSIDGTGPTGPFTNGSVNAPLDLSDMPAGTYTINAVKAPVGTDTVLSSITPSSSQTLIAGGAVTFTFNFVTSPPSRQKMYGIGSDNAIWRWNGDGSKDFPTQWARITSGSIQGDFVLVNNSETDIYAYGLDNQIWHWDGGSWSKVSSGGQLQKRMWYANPNLIYGIGLDNQIWKWTGGSNFAPVAPGGQVKDDFVLANNSENAIFAIGLDNEIWHWDGSRWSHASSLGKLKQRLFVNFVSVPTPTVSTPPSQNPSIHPPAVSCTSGSPQVALSWSDGGASINHIGYTRDDYFLFRSPPGGNRPIDGINFGYDRSRNYRYTDTNVRSGTTYSYYLIAQRFTRDDVEISRRSNTVEATPVCITIPEPVADANTACPAGSASNAQSLGGRALSQPVVENFWSDDRLIIAVRGMDNGVYVKEWKQGVLMEWYFISGYTLDRPKFVVEQNQLWLYVKGVDGYVYKNRYTHPGTWSGWSATGASNDGFGVAGPSAVATSWGTYWIDGLNPIVVNMCTANPPDLTSGPVSPTSATAGTAATYSATISNTGTSSTGAGFTNLFQRAADSSGAGATDIGTAQLSALSSGAVAVVSLSYTFASSGTYYLRACADKSSSSGTGTIVESNDSNNCGAWTAVAVAPAAPPPTATLSAGPTVIDQGQSSILSWSSTNSTSCSAVGGFSTGGITSGSVSVSPSTTSNYQVNCTGPGGSVNSNIVTVTVVSVTVSISAAPTCISGGGSSTISWSATPASQVTSCTVSGPGLSSSQVSGSQTVNATSRSTYVIACQTISGSTITKQAIVDTAGCWSEF